MSLGGPQPQCLTKPAAINDKNKVLASRIEQLARRHNQWGVLKIYRRLRKQGELVSHKRIRRTIITGLKDAGMLH